MEDLEKSWDLKNGYFKAWKKNTQSFWKSHGNVLY